MRDKQTVLVAGASGFLGSEIVHSLGGSYRVVAFSRSKNQRTAKFPYEVTQISDLKEVPSCDAIINAAVLYSGTDEEIRDANVRFPLRLLEAIPQSAPARFIHFDTFFTKEGFHYSHLRPYQASKEECRTALLDKKGTAPIISLRLEQVYGPSDDPKKGIHQLLLSILKGQPSLELSPGEQKRDFIFVRDVADAVKTVLSNQLPAGLFHEYEVGTGTSLSLRRFLETAKEVFQSKTELRFGALPYREGEIMDSAANPAALKLLGWEPSYSIKEGLKTYLPLKTAF